MKEFGGKKVWAISGYFDQLFSRAVHVGELLCIGETCTDEAALRILLDLPPLPDTATSTDDGTNSDDNNVPDYTDVRTGNASAQRGDLLGGVFSGSSGGIRIGLVVVGVVSAIALFFMIAKN